MLKTNAITLLFLIPLSLFGANSSKDPNLALKEKVKKLESENRSLEEKRDYTQKLQKLEEKNGKLKLENECVEKNSKSCVRIAFHYMAEKNRAKTREYFKMACDMEDPEGCYNWGINLQESNEFKEAVLPLKRGCGLKHAGSCNNLGFNYFKLGNHRETEGYFKKACDLKMKEACSNLAKLIVKQNRVEEAKTYFKKACDLGEASSCNPVLPKSTLTSTTKSNDQDDTLKKVSDACEKDSKDDCYNKGYILMVSGNHDGASKAFAHSCELGDTLSCGYLGVLIKNDELITAVEKELISKCDAGSKLECFYCSTLYGLASRVDDSLKFLEKALKLNFSEWDQIDSAYELNATRKDSRYISLIKKYRK